jgi:hypothetical protein
VFVTDGRFLSAGSNRLHQDLDGVDGHRPNLKQEVGGLDVRNKFKLIHKTKNKFKYRAKFNGKKSDEKVLFFLIWLGFQILV